MEKKIRYLIQKENMEMRQRDKNRRYKSSQFKSSQIPLLTSRLHTQQHGVTIKINTCIQPSTFNVVRQILLFPPVMESITYLQGTLFYNMNTNEKQINDKTFNSYQYNSVVRIKIIIQKNVKSIQIKRLSKNANKCQVFDKNVVRSFTSFICMRHIYLIMFGCSQNYFGTYFLIMLDK